MLSHVLKILSPFSKVCDPFLKICHSMPPNISFHGAPKLCDDIVNGNRYKVILAMLEYPIRKSIEVEAH